VTSPPVNISSRTSMNGFSRSPTAKSTTPTHALAPEQALHELVLNELLVRIDVGVLGDPWNTRPDAVRLRGIEVLTLR
jgi:hypothetical protein